MTNVHGSTKQLECVVLKDRYVYEHDSYIHFLWIYSVYCHGACIYV